MPLAKLIYDKYWSTPSINGPMAQFLIGKGYADGSAKPGRPIADAGPSQLVKARSVRLSAAMSLYANTYQWSITSGPTGASLSDSSGVAPIFSTVADGAYVVQLVVGNGVSVSAPVSTSVVVNSALSYDPPALRFAHIKTILQTGAGGCTTCHQSGGNGAVIPPIWYSSYDRAGTGDPNDATNDHWFYTELRGRVNFTDLASSPLLRKPSGNHHNGGRRTGFNADLQPGDAGRVDYDKILSWILNGAPE